MKRSGAVIVLFVITVMVIFGSWQTDLRGPLIQTIERPSSNAGKTHASGILLSLSQNSIILVRGSPAQIAVYVNTTPSNSFRITLSSQQVPLGVMVSFSPSSGRSSFVSTMTILAGSASPLGSFYLTITASGGGITRVSTLTVLVVTLVHDLAVIRASAPSNATIGSIVVVKATVANYGSVSESFTAELYANNSIVETQPSTTLSPATEKETTISWNTTGLIAGKYALVVVVLHVSGESDIADNNLQAGYVLLVKPSISNPSPPTPQPGSTQPAPTNWRELAIAVAIAWIAIVALFFFRKPIRGALPKKRV